MLHSIYLPDVRCDTRLWLEMVSLVPVHDLGPDNR